MFFAAENGNKCKHKMPDFRFCAYIPIFAHPLYFLQYHSPAVYAKIRLETAVRRMKGMII